MVRPVIQDQYTAARVYFASVVGVLFLEGLLRLPAYLGLRYRRGRPRRTSPHWRATVVVHGLLARPLPVPFMADWHGADVVRAAVVVALNVVFGLNDNNYTTDYKLYGWLSIANGGIALLTAARTNLFALVLRVPSPVVLQYHRWAGMATVAHATAHLSFNLMHYLATDQVATSFESPRIRVGLVAWLALAIMLLTALPVVRRRGFEVFYYAHALFFVFVVGALVHTTNGPEFLLPGFSLWLVDRAVRFAYGFRRIDVLNVGHYPGGLTKFRVRGVRTSRPGQVVWVQLPGVSLLNWHPFTVASAPGDADGDATIAVRGLGRYTKGVARVDDGDEGRVRMRLDGPYGVGRTQWGALPVTVLVAGGVGVTPAISIVSHLVKTAAASAGETSTVSHIHLLWIVKDACHVQWFEDELRELHALAGRHDVPATLDVTIHATVGAGSTVVDSARGLEKPAVVDESEAPSNPWSVRAGRPDMAAWFGQVKQARAGSDAAVDVCGPRTLINEVRRAAVTANGREGLFYVKEEVFEL